jgi:tryptophan-rich sensory protein
MFEFFPFKVVPTAWTILYTSMGYASWRVWKFGGDRAKIPLLIYMIKLLLNWLWPLIAFGLGSILGAIIDTVFLQIFVVLTGILFYRIDTIAGLLFIPYFLYLSYVLVLCSHIYIINL